MSGDGGGAGPGSVPAENGLQKHQASSSDGPTFTQMLPMQLHPSTADYSASYPNQMVNGSNGYAEWPIDDAPAQFQSMAYPNDMMQVPTGQEGITSSSSSSDFYLYPQYHDATATTTCPTGIGEVPLEEKKDVALPKHDRSLHSSYEENEPLVKKSRSVSTKKSGKNSSLVIYQKKGSSIEGIPEIKTNEKSKSDSTKNIEKSSPDAVDQIQSNNDFPQIKTKEKSKSESAKNVEKSTSDDVDQKDESSGEDFSQANTWKKRNPSNRNGRKLACPVCEFRTHVVNSLVSHLNNVHSTNLRLAGFTLRCDCGEEVLSDSHLRRNTCGMANYTMIRKGDGPILTYNDPKIIAKKTVRVSPQCFMCEAYPETMGGYARHLQVTHKSSLKDTGSYLMCACGLKVTYANNKNEPIHKQKCDGRKFTLHEYEDEE